MKYNTKKNETILSDEEIKAAHRLLKYGETQREVCEILGGINVKTLKRALKIKGIEIDKSWNKSKLTGYQTKLINMLFKNGLTTNEVAKEVGLTFNELQHSMEASGLSRHKTDFRITNDIKFKVRQGIADGKSIKSIAKNLDTKEFFIKLVIVSIGSHLFFKKLKRPTDKRHGLTHKKIERFIKHKLKGGSTPDIVKELGTTRQTMDMIINKIVNNVIKYIK